VYARDSGKLQLLKLDSNGNGKPDTFSYMDGARIIRIEIDKDEDGLIDRWEYYGADQKLEKVGFSRGANGREDAWSYFAPDGSIARIEMADKSGPAVTRIEYYDHATLLRAEEDTDGDGRMDKWEAFEGGRLASVSFDTMHRGTPDRRIVYGANGAGQMEIDPSGAGHFVAGR